MTRLTSSAGIGLSPLARVLAVVVLATVVVELGIRLALGQAPGLPGWTLVALCGLMLGAAVTVPLLYTARVRPPRLGATGRHGGGGGRKQDAERFQTLAERSPIGMYIVQDDAFQYVNHRFATLTGFTVDELLGPNPLDFVLPEDRAMVRENAVRMLRSQAAGEYEYRLRNKAGEVRWVIENVVSLDYRGRRAAYGYYVDITDRKQAEDAVRASEERYRTTFQHLQDVLFKTDENGVLTMVSPSVRKLLGYAPEELLGSNSLSFYADRAEARAVNELVLAGKPVEDREAQFVRKDGGHIIVSISASLVFGEGRDRIAVQGIVRDITARKLAEQRFQTLSERSPIGIYIVQDDAFQYVNPRFVELTGFGIDELVGSNPLDLVIPEDRQSVRENAVSMLRGIRAEAYEYRLRNKVGEMRCIMENVVSLEYKGRPASYGYFIDITDRKRAEDAVHISEERYRTTFQHLRDVLFKTDENGIMTMVSPSVQKLLGYAPEELLGANARIFYADTTEADAILKLVLAGKVIEDCEARFVRKDGGHVVISLAASLIFGEGEDRVAVQGIVRDISARKLAEEERDRYFEMSVDPLAVTDMEMRFRRVNPAWERVLGFTQAEMLGRTVMRFAYPADREAMIVAGRETADGKALEDRRGRFLTRGGEIRWLSWNTTPVTNGVSYSVVRDVTDQVRAQEEQDEMMALLEENSRMLTEQAVELDTLRSKAEYAADHDMLTGLLNRRAWFGTAVADRGSAVALLDIDHFKRINDTWGHPAGDEVLIEVAGRLQSSLGDTTLGRVGGEEFAVLFSGPLAAAAEACQQALTAVASEPIRLRCGEEIVITLSGGLAPWHRGRLSREDALARTYEAADQALYAAKARGRACVTVSESLKVA